MGSVLRTDKIGTLQESGGNIQLGPSTLTIGGRQFVTNATIQVALPSLTANTRYQVFAVRNAGNTELVISTNENSVGPVGFDSWKLVGSLYADGSASFGTFINIKGRPVSTTEIDTGVVPITSTASSPGKGTIVRDSVFMARDGGFGLFKIRYQHSAAGSDGTGTYLFGLNTFQVVSARQPFSSTVDFREPVGEGISAEGSSDATSKIFAYDISRFYATFINSVGAGTSDFGTIGQTNYNMGASNIAWIFDVRVPIVGWSDTPIEDL